MGLGPGALGVMVAFFVIGSTATRLGYQTKAARGIAQEKGGARGWRNAWANGGVPALLALLGGMAPAGVRELFVLAYAASVATAAADTCSSEVGKAYGRRTFLITTLRAGGRRGRRRSARPLPAGRLSMREAWGFTLAAFVVAWVLAWLASPACPAELLARRECFWIVLFTSVLVWAYSAPPFRTKRHGIWANVAIAVPRGVLLKVAGWSTVKTVMGLEPWSIGSIFGLFLLGASSTKDFADIEGDRAGGCQTLPILFGVKAAAWMIAPFFVFPFLLIPIGVWRGVLTGNATLLMILGPALTLYGIYTVYLLVRRPEELAATENHPSWTHMYRMMMVAQIGFALAYVF